MKTFIQKLPMVPLFIIGAPLLVIVAIIDHKRAKEVAMDLEPPEQIEYKSTTHWLACKTLGVIAPMIAIPLILVVGLFQWMFGKEDPDTIIW